MADSKAHRDWMAQNTTMVGLRLNHNTDADILAALEGAPMLMTRGVLYTAITRARELFIIVGDQGTVAQMVANDRQTRRYSGLRARLAEGSWTRNE